jgi:alpha-glucosidase (family GH31 glycosyl hydrolase)
MYPYLMTLVQTNHTWQAVYERSNPPKRPFVLTRSFYAGSQRYGAMWTGDNLGTWDHMAVGIKMVLANSIAGMSFAGCERFLSSCIVESLLNGIDHYSRRWRFLW